MSAMQRTDSDRSINRISSRSALLESARTSQDDKTQDRAVLTDGTEDSVDHSGVGARSMKAAEVDRARRSRTRSNVTFASFATTDAPAEGDLPSGGSRRYSGDSYSGRRYSDSLRRTDSDPTVLHGASAAAQSRERSKKAYFWAIGLALPVSLLCFTVQTELAQYIQRDLHYSKPYFMLYLTHSSWWLNGVGLFLFLRLKNRRQSSAAVFHRMVDDVSRMVHEIEQHSRFVRGNPWRHMAFVVAVLGICLTIAGGTWYVAVNLTTASDVSAIYNASAFFAYAFAVPLLGEKLRIDKVAAVLISILGVFIIAYGDRDPAAGSGGGAGGGAEDGRSMGKRTLGNLTISIGAVLYGLYEVLYKKWACPPENLGDNVATDSSLSHSARSGRYSQDDRERAHLAADEFDVSDSDDALSDDDSDDGGGGNRRNGSAVPHHRRHTRQSSRARAHAQKQLAPSPTLADPSQSILLANFVATCLGLFTLCVMWMPIPVLHALKWEEFALPPASATVALGASIAANFVYSACLLAMISLTGPVLSSVASLLSIFCVAVTDTVVTGRALSAAALLGGGMILVAFAVLVYATYVDVAEEARRKETDRLARLADAGGDGAADVV